VGVDPEWRYRPTVKYTELNEGMTLVNQAGEKWVIKAIDKTGVLGRWAYTLVNPVTGYEWRRPFTEVERYLKSESTMPKAKASVPKGKLTTKEPWQMTEAEFNREALRGTFPRATFGGKPLAKLTDKEGA